MTQIAEEEIKRGLVGFIDPAMLRARGLSECNAFPGQEVGESHYFVVLQVEGESCLAMPLYSEPGKDRAKLNRRFKAGHPENWTDQDSYVFRWQFWRIPLAEFSRASHSDTSDATSRRNVNERGAALLDELEGALPKAKQPFRKLT